MAINDHRLKKKLCEVFEKNSDIVSEIEVAYLHFRVMVEFGN